MIKTYSGNFQKLKYDAKKEDYFVTFNRQKFYLNDCITSPRWTSAEDKNLIGTWQEGLSVYKLVSKDDKINFSDSSLCKIVYCLPSS